MTLRAGKTSSTLPLVTLSRIPRRRRSFEGRRRFKRKDRSKISIRASSDGFVFSSKNNKILPSDDGKRSRTEQIDETSKATVPTVHVVAVRRYHRSVSKTCQSQEKENDVDEGQEPITAPSPERKPSTARTPSRSSPQHSHGSKDIKHHQTSIGDIPVMLARTKTRKKRKFSGTFCSPCSPLYLWLSLLCSLLVIATAIGVPLSYILSRTTSTTITTVAGTTITSASATTTTSDYSVSKSNIITNGNAESGLCESGSGVTSPTGWNVNGTITQIYYNNSANAGHSPTIPGPSDRGDCYFYGQICASTSMWQTINLTDFANPTLIDAQQVKFSLSAWLGGYGSQDDNTQVSIVFMNQANQVLASGITIGPVLAIDRSSQTELLYRQTNGSVPANARQVTVIVTMVRISGTTCNSDADNIALNLYL